MSIKICLFGPTGSGKTTIAKYLLERGDVELIKIAKPLYEFQNEFYSSINKEIIGQDGELLQFLGQKIEKENPQWLARQFLEKVKLTNKAIVVNDDCRLNSYHALRRSGFVFVRIFSTDEIIEKRLRKDHIIIDKNHPVEAGFELFNSDYIVDNNGTFEDTCLQINEIIKDIISGTSGWLTGSKIKDEVDKGNIIIEPFIDKNLNPNSYNYHLGNTLKRLTAEVIDTKNQDEYESIEIPNEGYVLSPGECYLGSTQEVFGSPIYASLITGRSSIGRKFLTNHITAGLIDQGFIGNITLEIVAHKPTKIYPGIEFGQIFWFTTFGYPFLYQGKYQNQLGPTVSRFHEDMK